MGGEGRRFKAVCPKQFIELAGKPVYLHTLETFLKFDQFEEIILVCHPDWLGKVRKETKNPKVRVVEGGATRQNSVYLGLIACGKGTDFVIIHDAVRPFVSRAIIERNISALKEHRAVNTCTPSTDTVVYSESDDRVTEIPERDHCLLGQTPQSFSYPLILKAHEQTRGQTASDDCGLVLKLGGAVHIVPGSPGNIKITNPFDLSLAEQLLHLECDLTDDSPSLEGKVYAITGGTGGIGRSLATLLKQKGAKTVIISRSSSEFPVDLTHFQRVSSTFKEIRDQHGLIDGLINCVGRLLIKPFNELSSQEIDQLVHINLHTFLYSCHCVALKKGGHILNLSSSSFSYGRKDYAIYAAVKAAIVNFTQGLAKEHPDLMINVMVPQRTRTPMRLKNFPKEDPITLLSAQSVAQKIVQVLQTERISGKTIEVRKEVF